ncbi:hypothetical protein SAMN05421890_0559 [Ensifer adhaerens]|nr:hypothetical protein SAMN05421890_0559 [Ensifer adhaerens]
MQRHWEEAANASTVIIMPEIWTKANQFLCIAAMQMLHRM